MNNLYLILVSICFILFGIASFCVFIISEWILAEVFTLISPLIGIAIAIYSLKLFFKSKSHD